MFESIIITKMKLDLLRLSGVITDGPPAMVEDEKWFVALLQNHIGIDQQQIKLQCIIHEEVFCAKSLNFMDMMAVVAKMVNVIMPGLSHRQLKEFLKHYKTVYGNLKYLMA